MIGDPSTNRLRYRSSLIACAKTDPVLRGSTIKLTV
jgi:hypothetical protein